MKCKTCGEPEHPGFTCIDVPVRPNPSPRDIFQHIKTDCERKAFDEFMLWNSNQYRVPWEDSLGESVIYALKKDKPSWYSWLQQKGLVQKEKVKKEFTAHWNTGDHRLVIGNNTIPAHTDYSETYRWEE